MILRLFVHIELHPGYGLTFRAGRMARPGDRFINGGQPGTLRRCPLCSGDGTLHVPDAEPVATPPEPGDSPGV